VDWVAVPKELRARRVNSEYPIPWEDKDMDASWLGNRLLLFPYVLEPQVNGTKPRLFWNGEMLMS
jgi:hypothetical protein